MSLSIAILWLIGGIVIGAVAARFYSLRQFNQNKLQVELDESRQQLQKYRSDVPDHLETTHQLMTPAAGQLRKNCPPYGQNQDAVDRTASLKREQALWLALSADTAEQLRMSIDKIDEKRRKKVDECASNHLIMQAILVV